MPDLIDPSADLPPISIITQTIGVITPNGTPPSFGCKVFGSVKEIEEAFHAATRERHSHVWFTGVTQDGSPGGPIGIHLLTPGIINITIEPDRDIVSRVARPSLGDIKSLNKKTH